MQGEVASERDALRELKQFMERLRRVEAVATGAYGDRNTEGRPRGWRPVGFLCDEIVVVAEAPRGGS